MIPSPEVQSKIAIWRQKAIDGTLTKEEMMQAILIVRGDRKSAAVASEKATTTRAKTAKGKPVLNADDLLNDLEGL